MLTCREQPAVDSSTVRDQLIELHRAVATTLGHDQFLFHLLDDALHSGFEPAQLAALAEFERQPQEVKDFVRTAMNGQRG